MNPTLTIDTPRWVSFLSGASAGLADTCLNYPPYCLHYNLQRGANIWSKSMYWKPRELYRGVFAYSAIIPITCITDGMTDFFKSKGVRNDVAPFISGMLAATVVSAPIGNSIVTDLRLKDSGKPAGLKNALHHLTSTYGWRGFYTGIGPLMAREGIYAWSVFYGKGAFQEKYNWNDIQASVAAGSIATALSQPVDTLATYMQNQVSRKSTFECIRMMWKENGIQRFYRGFYFRLYAIIAGVYVMDRVSGNVKAALERSI